MDKPRCSEMIRGSGTWGSFNRHQCTRKGTVEENGKWFCKQHSTAAREKREQQSVARNVQRTQAWRDGEYRKAERIMLPRLKELTFAFLMNELMAETGLSATRCQELSEMYDVLLKSELGEEWRKSP